MRTFKSKAPGAIAQLSAAAFRKYAPALHRYVLRRLRQPQDAPDLTQAIFERFLQMQDTELVRNPQAYLFGIASHVVSEFRMREDKNLVTYDSQMVDQAAAGLAHAAPDTLAEQLNLQREMDRALARLSAAHRAVLLLVKRDGLSYEEAAAAMGLTVNTVATYVMEARAKMRGILDRRLADEETQP
jgi:RNA polymerase sigma factor (sigma-70 family)